MAADSVFSGSQVGRVGTFWCDYGADKPKHCCKKGLINFITTMHKPVGWTPKPGPIMDCTAVSVQQIGFTLALASPAHWMLDHQRIAPRSDDTGMRVD